jgi:hypothetical protein
MQKVRRAPDSDLVVVDVVDTQTNSQAWCEDHRAPAQGPGNAITQNKHLDGSGGSSICTSSDDDDDDDETFVMDEPEVGA